jgi:hypothetical protein
MEVKPMKTFRLWLEPDKEIPQFKRLAYERVDVSIADVLLRGIHPWIEAEENRSLNQRFMAILNDDESKLPELAEFSYCGDLSCTVQSYNYSPMPAFQENLERIKKNIYFVGELSYVELLSMAKRRVRKKWNHSFARNMLGSALGTFNSMRSFLKQKDKSLKLSGYYDLEKYDLGQVLSLEDFEGYDSVVISHGMPFTNFRSENFIGSVTDQRGLLRMTDRIRHFNVVVNRYGGGEANGTVIYNCRLEGERVRMLPDLKGSFHTRKIAQIVALERAMDDGRYCFTTDIPTLADLIEGRDVGIRFPKLNYVGESHGGVSTAMVAKSQVERFSIGRFATANDPGEHIKSILRSHGISMTGNKEKLGGKLAKLSAELYREYEAEMETYFRANRFVRNENGQTPNGSRFPALEEVDMRNMLLAMYAVKHLRGNTILEASHVNDTFELEDLAKALIKGDVSVNGVFLRIE